MEAKRGKLAKRLLGISIGNQRSEAVLSGPLVAVETELPVDRGVALTNRPEEIVRRLTPRKRLDIDGRNVRSIDDKSHRTRTLSGLTGIAGLIKRNVRGDHQSGFIASRP